MGFPLRQRCSAWHRPSVHLVASVVAALAWSPIPGTVGNTVVPSMLVTRAGTELVSFESPDAGTISVVRGGAPRIVVASDPAAGRTQLVFILEENQKSARAIGA